MSYRFRRARRARDRSVAGGVRSGAHAGATPRHREPRRPFATPRFVRKRVAPARLIDFLRGRVVKWWLPDAVVFVEEIPHTATGKIRKTQLRTRFADFSLPL